MKARPLANERQAQTVRVYRADNRFSEGAVAALRNLLGEVWRHRAHVKLIFSRDFKASYRGTALGVFWNFVLPLLPVSVYVFLSVLGVFPPADNLPRGVFVAFNVTLWLLFSGLVEQPISVIKSRNAEAMKTSMPLSVAVASGFATLAFETLLRFLLVAILVVATQAVPALTLPLALGVLFLGALFSLSVGLVLAIANIAVPDVQSIVVVIMRYGIFVSGVIFPLSAIGQLEWLEIINPFAIFIHAIRDLTFHGTLTYPIPLAVMGAITVVAVLFSARVFYLMEYRIRGIV